MEWLEPGFLLLCPLILRAQYSCNREVCPLIKGLSALLRKISCGGAHAPHAPFLLCSAQLHSDFATLGVGLHALLKLQQLLGPIAMASGAPLWQG